jgi:hypothetical protein
MRKFRITIPTADSDRPAHAFSLEGDFISFDGVGGFRISTRELGWGGLVASYAPGAWLSVIDVTDED